jgi:PadR family transcriptional regulator, regulatory protein AphA
VSLSHALLGLLAVAPASGYELTREFEREIGRYAWQAGHTSIYPELGRLADRGLVKVIDEGPRGRRTYDITAAGRAELRSWLFEPPGRDGAVRTATVLRMFLLSALKPAEARRLLRGIAERSAEDAAALRADLADKPRRSGPRAGFGKLAAEYGLRHYDAVHGWALWALRELGEDDDADDDADDSSGSVTEAG